MESTQSLLLALVRFVMNVFKVCCYVFLYSTISACSLTAKSSLTVQSNQYYAKDFIHTEFSQNSEKSLKKPASSDLQLMLSLLNRPVPEDQRMMLAFAKSQKEYLPDSTIVGISIRGEKSADKTNSRTRSNYAHLIETDHNAVVISAMPK